MNIFANLIEGFKKVYKGPNALVKHIGLLALTGLVSVASVYIENISKTIEQAPQLPDLSTILGIVILLILLGIYFGGYNLIFSHNSFLAEQEEYMPDINFEPIKIFFKALPLMICWGFYITVACIVAAGICTIKTSPISVIIGILLMSVILLACGFVQFIYTAYTKNFDQAGLFNITLPFKYMKYCFGEFVLLGLLFIPVYIISMLPSFIVGFIMGLTSPNDSTVAIYLGGILGGYAGLIIQLVWYYCLVQIYKEKIEPNLH